jgi:hypothetical protein
MRKTVTAKKEPEKKPYFFDPKKETKKEREARINAIVKKALEGITPRPDTQNLVSSISPAGSDKSLAFFGEIWYF